MKLYGIYSEESIVYHLAETDDDPLMELMTGLEANCGRPMMQLFQPHRDSILSGVKESVEQAVERGLVCGRCLAKS